MNIKKILVCKCGYKSFSVIDQVNTDIDLGNGSISMRLDVECDSCGEITRETIDAVITDVY